MSVCSALVLVVDDEPLILDLLEAALEEGGFEVVTAGTAETGLSALEARAVKLTALVTDINLGRGASGWEVAARARQLAPRLPVVYVSGDSAHDWQRKGVPGSEMICKPFAPDQLVVAIENLTKAASLR